MRCFMLTALLAFVPATQAQDGPQTNSPYVEISPLVQGVSGGLRLLHDPSTGALFYLIGTGEIYRLDAPFGANAPELVASTADHGLGYPVFGLAAGPDGTLYLSGNIRDTEAALNVGVVMRGRALEGGGRAWETVMRTVPYPLSNAFDHLINALAISPDGESLFVNSGSRTDHGEVQDAGGRHPGLREVPLTSAILRIPTDATDLVLQNDEAFLADNGYLFADGVRNTFALAFDAEGRLLGAENAGDRDDPDELNVIEEGRHYGFPWRIGGNATPQQFPGYNPAEDLLLNPAALAVQQGFFYDDPGFPPPPEGVVFTEPVQNVGYADHYRDPATGEILRASQQNTTISTFTSHRSPLGLVFDTANSAKGCRGCGFVLSWTGTESPLLAAMEDEGEDLIQFGLNAADDGGYILYANPIATNFVNPIDAALVGSTLYVLEFGTEVGIWKVDLLGGLAVDDAAENAVFSVSAYPNPAAGVARVTVRAEQPQRVAAELYTTLGQRVWRAAEQIVGAEAQFSLDTGALAPGAYVLRVAGETATVVQRLTVTGR